MLISISDRSGDLDEQLKELTERRILFALSRYDSRVERVEVVFEDENGPRGGIDKSCRVAVSMARGADVVVTNRDDQIARCISRAAERAGRAVARTVARSQHFDRIRVSQ